MKKFISFLFVLYFIFNIGIVSFASSLSYGVSAMGLDLYYEYLQKADYNHKVTVAVVDSGVADIEFLSDKLISGYDFIEETSLSMVDKSADSHGTLIASMIADITKDLPVKIMPVRILEDKNVLIENLVSGIKYAVDNGADVINLSVGGAISDCTEIDSAIDYACDKDVIVVVAAGNTKREITDYCPAHNEDAITVSAVDYNNKFAKKFSNFGEFIDCCAPGVSVVGYDATGMPKTVSGTSFSAAFISAGVAMMRLENPELRAENIQEKLASICSDLGESGFDYYYGFGLPEFDKLRKPSVEINKIEGYVDYKSSVTFNANLINLPENAEIVWLVNDIAVGTGQSYTMSDIKDDFNIKAVINVDGEYIAQSQYLKIHVKNGFYDKLVAYIRLIINWITSAIYILF